MIKNGNKLYSWMNEHPLKMQNSSDTCKMSAPQVILMIA